ncbi:MAG: biopolymer transporter ExbD [Candidatus Auribacterota bacterium]
MFAEEINQKKKMGINITPLIDVVFLLLIFFMVSSTFIEKPGIDLSLPKAKTAEMQKAENIIITLDKTGVIYINGEKISPDILGKELSKLRLEKSADEPVILEADENIPYKDVIFVMDTARDIGFSSIVALTTTQNE